MRPLIVSSGISRRSISGLAHSEIVKLSRGAAAAAAGAASTSAKRRPSFATQATPVAACARSSITKVDPAGDRSEEHTSELQSLMRISYAVFCLKKKKKKRNKTKQRIL